MLHSDQGQARAFLSRIKAELERELEQQELLIVEREVARFD